MAAPQKIDASTRERAVRMYHEHLANAPHSKVAARMHAGSTLGVYPVSLRDWIEARSAASSPEWPPESARLALILDADCGVKQRAGLAECLFSLEGMVALLHSQAHPQPQPEVGASDLLDRLEGHILRNLILAVPA